MSTIIGLYPWLGDATSAFESVNHRQQAMRHPLYKTDPDYRDLVAAKLAVTSVPTVRSTDNDQHTVSGTTVRNNGIRRITLDSDAAREVRQAAANAKAQEERSVKAQAEVDEAKKRQATMKAEDAMIGEPAESAKPFASHEEMRAAFKNPRYNQDQGFRDAVAARVAKGTPES